MSASYYPVNEERNEEYIRLSVRLTKEQREDVDVFVKLWNEFDRITGRKTGRKWKAASVIERLIAVGIDGFWAQVGGRPATSEGREDFARRALERLKKADATKR